MKLHYYADTDSLYVEFKPGPGAETREVSDGLNVDLDAAGNVVGFDIDRASARLDCFHSGGRSPSRVELHPRLSLRVGEIVAEGFRDLRISHYKSVG